MTPERLSGLAVFAFVSSITPGPNNLMLLASGLNYGIRRTVPHMLGVAGGFVLMVLGVGFGLATLFDLVPAAQSIIKILCLIYLLYLAYRMTKAGPISNGKGGAGGRPMRFWEAVAFQWVNPKAWAMALTGFASYAEGGAAASTLTIAGVFGLINLPSVAAWSVFGLALRRFLDDPVRIKWFNWTMAILLVLSVVPFLVSAS